MEKIKLEAGRIYRTRGGHFAFIESIVGTVASGFLIGSTFHFSQTWKLDGAAQAELDGRDIVAVIAEPLAGVFVDTTMRRLSELELSCQAFEKQIKKNRDRTQDGLNQLESQTRDLRRRVEGKLYRSTFFAFVMLSVLMVGVASLLLYTHRARIEQLQERIEELEELPVMELVFRQAEFEQHYRDMQRALQSAGIDVPKLKYAGEDQRQ